MKTLITSFLITLSLSTLASLPCNGEAGSYFINSSGELGGFVADTATVESTVYLGKNVQICGEAEVREFAQITGYAVIKDFAKVYGSAHVYGEATIFENAEVYDRANVWGKAKVYGHAKIYGFAGLKDNVRVYGKARMFDATFGGDAVYF